MPPILEDELELEAFLEFPEGEGPGRIWDFIKRRALPKLRKYGTIVRILGMGSHPLPEPAVVPEPPPIVETDQRKKPKQGQYEMEHFAQAAAEAETAEAADDYIGALVPAAANLASMGKGAILRAAPQLSRCLKGATRLLRRTPETRPLVRTLPAALRRTVAKAERQAAEGRSPSPQAVARDLARSMAEMLNDPRRSTIALCRSQALARRRRQP